MPLAARLDAHQGRWVADLDGEVVAEAANPRELVVEVSKLGEAGRNAVARYIPERSEVTVIGVG